MDPNPYKLDADMPLARLFPLFASGVVQNAIVISKHGHFIGILSRKNLIAAAIAAEKGLPVGSTQVTPLTPVEPTTVTIPRDIPPSAISTPDVCFSPKVARAVFRRRQARNDTSNANSPNRGRSHESVLSYISAVS